MSHSRANHNPTPKTLPLKAPTMVFLTEYAFGQITFSPKVIDPLISYLPFSTFPRSLKSAPAQKDVPDPDKTAA
jgi:hypothetical protein